MNALRVLVDSYGRDLEFPLAPGLTFFEDKPDAHLLQPGTSSRR